MTSSPAALYRAMLRIRLAEEQIGAWVEDGTARTPCHLSIGQEAIPAGVCAALGAEDTVWGGHRSHGHYLARGGDLTALLAEVLGRATGCCGGRGGSMHLQAPEAGVMGTVPLVGATVPLAVGNALAAKLRGEQRIAVAFFGDGAMEEGTVLESLNLAASLRVPVLFVCENNFYASHMHIDERRVGTLSSVAEAMGLHAEMVDGNDVEEVFAAADDATKSLCTLGSMPWFIECATYRHRGHVGASYDMDVGLKRRGELSVWIKRDPIDRYRPLLPPADAAQVDADVHDEVFQAAKAALAAPWPDPAAVLEGVFR